MANYNDPCPPKDGWAQGLYRKYNLGDTPTMEAIEPVALQLLSDVTTSMTGAELVLGRRVDAKEMDVAMLCMFGAPERKFAALLLRRDCEQ